MREYSLEAKCDCGGMYRLKYFNKPYIEIGVTINNIPHYVCDIFPLEHVITARRTRIHLKRCLVHAVAEGIKEMEYSENVPIQEFE
jgi:F420-0:gamma-glutamyl ligase-like protein